MMDELFSEDIARAIAELREEVWQLRSHVVADVAVYVFADATAPATVPSDTLAEIEWDGVEGRTDTVAGSEFVAPRRALYVIAATIRWEANGQGIRRISVRRYVGSNVTVIASQTAAGDASREADCSVVAMAWLDEGDRIRVGILQNSGGNLDVMLSMTHMYITTVG